MQTFILKMLEFVGKDCLLAVFFFVADQLVKLTDTQIDDDFINLLRKFFQTGELETKELVKVALKQAEKDERSIVNGETAAALELVMYPDE